MFISPNNSLDTVIFNPRNTHYQQKTAITDMQGTSNDFNLWKKNLYLV